MSAQRIGPKKLKRLERETGLDMVRAWSHGGYWFNFVTPEHKHGSVNCKTFEVEWDDGTRPSIMHYTSCSEMFPDE